MNLFYADESGAISDPKQMYFVLAGVSVFERQGFWISNELDKIAAQFDPSAPESVELHGSPMLNGRKFWRKFPLPTRIDAMKNSLKVLANSHHTTNVFACVIRKSTVFPKDPVEVAFEQLASRFDYYLRRLHKSEGNSQRGIIIFDKSTYETTIQSLATDFRKIGHTWDVIRNLAEVPLFLDSRASRLIQLADLVAYSIFRKYEHGDEQFLSIFGHRFDNSGGQIHGLCEIVNRSSP